jgi:hypothetical protein
MAKLQQALPNCSIQPWKHTKTWNPILRKPQPSGTQN